MTPPKVFLCHCEGTARPSIGKKLPSNWGMLHTAVHVRKRVILFTCGKTIISNLNNLAHSCKKPRYCKAITTPRNRSHVGARGIHVPTHELRPCGVGMCPCQLTYRYGGTGPSSGLPESPPGFCIKPWGFAPAALQIPCQRAGHLTLNPRLHGLEQSRLHGKYQP
jgi:hypothetical protein